MYLSGMMQVDPALDKVAAYKFLTLLLSVLCQALLSVLELLPYSPVPSHVQQFQKTV